MLLSRVVLARTIAALGFILSSTAVACRDYSTDPYKRPPESPVAVTYCAAATPMWLAFRDADGTWARALPEPSGSRNVFRHTFTGDRAAIASVTSVFGGAFTVLRVLYGAPAELATESDTSDADCVNGGPKTLRGNIAGVTTTKAVIVSLGPFARTSVQPLLGLDYTLEEVANGPQNLVATSTTGASLPARMIVRRDVDVPDGGTIPLLDFESAEAFDLGTANVTVDGLQGEPAVNLTMLLTSRGHFALPFASTRTAATQPYVTLPANKLLASDLQQLHVSTEGPSPRSVDLFFRTPSDRTLAIGEPIVRPTFSTIESVNVLRLRTQFVPQIGYDKASAIVYEQPERTAVTAITMTSAYAALSGGFVLDVPDLAAVSGFNTAWGLLPGVAVAWNAVRTGGTLPIGRDPVPFDGAVRRIAIASDVLTAP